MKNKFYKILSKILPFKRLRTHFRKLYKCDDWIGAHSYIGPGSYKSHPQSKIGKFCSVGKNVAIGPSQHPINSLSSSPFQYIEKFKLSKNQQLIKIDFLPTFVGNDVWIGNNAVIMDGLTIGDGAVIGAGAIVTHDVPPYAIVGGYRQKL